MTRNPAICPDCQSVASGHRQLAPLSSVREAERGLLITDDVNQVDAGRVDALGAVGLLRALRHGADQAEELVDAVFERQLADARRIRTPA